MTNFVLSELLLVSFAEKRAKRVRFDPWRTTIVGENDTGKSALLKSIYWTLGARPPEMHSTWEEANVTTLLRFRIAERSYAILRQGDLITLLDTDDQVLGTFTSVTKELAPALAELLNFAMVCPDRKGEVIIPPPAFYFLPFYVDQDKSWTDNWSGFASLQQLPNYRQMMAEYHSGIRPDEYYAASVDLAGAKREQQSLQAELRAVEAARNTFDERMPFEGFNVDASAFAADLERLITECQTLAVDENMFRGELQALRGESSSIDAQLALVQRELRELSADDTFASSLPSEIECPTCGTVHQNSFMERFSIARDEDRCVELRQQLMEDRRSVETRLTVARTSFSRTAREKSRVEELLATRKGELRLKDIIDARGRAQVQEIFDMTVAGYTARGRILEESIRTLEIALRRLTNRKRTTEILAYYRSRMREFLLRLDVMNLKPNSYQGIAARIHETGSDLPRALLAYYYSFLHTMKKHGSTVFCPIVIDEPNQQGLDVLKLPSVLNFIFEQQPEGSQLILGLEDLHGVEPGGKVIRLEHKWKLLRSDEYSDVAAEMRPLIERSFRMAAQ